MATIAPKRTILQEQSEKLPVKRKLTRKSEISGVHWNKNKWRATIQGETIGRYKTEEEAICARKNEEQLRGFKPKEKRACYSSDRDRKEARRISAALYRKNNREKHLNSSKASNMKTRYGISVKTFGKLRDVQRNCCLLCKKSFTSITPHIDHCHRTGTVRGILCSNCNTMLGLAQESPDILRRAAEYLDIHVSLAA